MMKAMSLLDPEFWHIPRWQKQSVSHFSYYLTFSCIFTRHLEEQTYPNIITDSINQPDLTYLIRQFLREQYQPESDPESASSTSSDLPDFHAKISVYSSAVATFYAPSDVSGVGGMRSERIHATNTWRNGPGRYDCIFVNIDSSDVARAQLFFSFKHEGKFFFCALVHWFCRVDDSPDELTGMWIVKPEFNDDGTRSASVINLDAIFRAAHLMPVFGNDTIPRYLSFTQTLDAFNSYYVNKYIDHHAFEIVF